MVRYLASSLTSTGWFLALCLSAISGTSVLNIQANHRLAVMWHCALRYIRPQWFHVTCCHVVFAEQEWLNPGRCVRHVLHLPVTASDSVVGHKCNTERYLSHWLVCQIQLLNKCSSYMDIINPEIWGVLGFPVQFIHNILPIDNFILPSVFVNWRLRRLSEFLPK
jgi:hypothetical protein